MQGNREKSLCLQGILIWGKNWPAPALAKMAGAKMAGAKMAGAIKGPNRPSGLSAPKCGLPLFANIAYLYKGPY